MGLPLDEGGVFCRPCLCLGHARAALAADHYRHAVLDRLLRLVGHAPRNARQGEVSAVDAQPVDGRESLVEAHAEEPAETGFLGRTVDDDAVYRIAYRVGGEDDAECVTSIQGDGSTHGLTLDHDLCRGILHVEAVEDVLSQSERGAESRPVVGGERGNSPCDLSLLSATDRMGILNASRALRHDVDARVLLNEQTVVSREQVLHRVRACGEDSP